MELPTELFYTKEHEWISGKSGNVKVGVSAFAIEQLGDIVHVDLPNVGDEIAAGDPFGSIESTKTVSDLYAPGTGKVVEVNSSIVDAPEALQEDAYDEGWLVKIELNTAISECMTSEEYENYLKNEE